MAHTLTLKKKLERAVAEGHPWIFSNALSGSLPKPGQVVTIVDSQKQFVARGLSEEGLIAVRVFCNQDVSLNKDIFSQRIKAAAELRRQILPPHTTAFRLLHGEGDRLPGLVCDIYADYAVMQLDGQAILSWQPVIVEILVPMLKKFGVKNLLWRFGKKQNRKIEALWGTLPEGPVNILEHNMKLWVDLVKGQKTGFFLDHRESRRRVGQLSEGKQVLNLFGYTGGFSVAAGLGGAQSVETVDRDAGACALANKNWLENQLDANHHLSHASPVQPFLESMVKKQKTYDLIVCDPPSFAPSQDKLHGALEAYRALHRAALGCLRPKGLYLAASCSSHVGMEAFESTVRHAAYKLKRVMQVLERAGTPPDHPKLSAFPEGDYLKVLLVRLLE